MSVIPTVSADGVGVISAGQLNAYEISCYNVGVLRTVVGQTGMSVFLQGTNTPNDGGQGNFYWDYASTATDNNYSVIRPYGVIYGAWLRTTVSSTIGGDVSNTTATATGTTTARTIANLFGDYISVKDFGADSTGTSDSTAAFQNAVNASNVVTVPPGTYLIAGSVTMPYGVKIIGYSDNATIRPSVSVGGGQVTLGGGSIINVTSTTGSPFLYYSGNSFEGLTFYYPNQLRTLSTPIVYPPTFSPNPAGGTTEVYVNVVWSNCQFVNSYRIINALVGHLDFQFYDLVGFPIYRGIETDGCGGTDIFKNISFSYYYFCYYLDPLALYAQANSQGFAIGRSDAVHMERIYCGNLNVGIRFFQGTINSTIGAYGSIVGLSFDGNNYGIYSEATDPIGMNIVDWLSNSKIYDMIIPTASQTTSNIQITGFLIWGSKTKCIVIDYAGSIVKLDNGQFFTYTTSAISCSVTGVQLTVINVAFEDSTATTIDTSAAQVSSLVITNNILPYPLSLHQPPATFTVINNNAGDTSSTVASATTINVLNIGDYVYLTGTTNVQTINGGWTGRTIIIVSQGGMSFVTGGNIATTKALAAGVGTSLVFDGGVWHVLS